MRKIVIRESRNRPTTPGELRMFYVADENEPNGEGHPQNIGRIFANKHQPPEFRPDDGAPDFTADTLLQIALILTRLEKERTDWIAVNPVTS